MTKADLLAVGGIGFRSSAELPYGTEFSIIKTPATQDSPCLASILRAPSRIEEIELESCEIAGQRFVVMNQSSSEEGYFSYIAVPAERLDQQAEEIEGNILRILLGLEK